MGIVFEYLVDSLPAKISLPSGKKTVSALQSHFKIFFQEIHRSFEKRSFSAYTVFYSIDEDLPSFQVNILKFQKSGLRDPEAIEVNKTKKGLVAGIFDIRKKPLNLFF